MFGLERSGFYKERGQQKMWKWLVRTAEPAEKLRDPVERHKARLMAGILLLVVPVGLVAVLAT